MISLQRELHAAARRIRQMGEQPVIEENVLDREADLLDGLARLARNMEQELAVHRLTEAGKAGRQIVDALASEQFADLAKDADAKIIRPDFGGRS
ncbi:hypothetical protein [Rhizobium paknamense]|uniref:Uncharacterized protein n=1 Tax=Rhizobium paknamense TaxID=1206817 RepID=A0ABU0IA97_9HYPH|nr:hypothetical protein [Rhizobium paknamense]MDQ0454627.1 hypothetical protein [Rhizobium paknamense]